MNKIAFNGEGKFEACPIARWLAVFLYARNEGPRLFRTRKSETCGNFKHAKTRFAVFADRAQKRLIGRFMVLANARNGGRGYCECAKTRFVVIVNAHKRGSR